METGTLLIAETDPLLLAHLPRLIACDLPGVEVLICTSTPSAVERLAQVDCSVVIAAPHLIRGDPSLIRRHERKRHTIVPLVITASQEDPESAYDVLLQRGAFDILAKPVDPTEAIASIRLVLWQAQFLMSLTQRQRNAQRFGRHLEAYPHEGGRSGETARILKMVDDMLRLLQGGKEVVDPLLDALLIDLAGSVEEWTKDRAVEPLENIRRADRSGCDEGCSLPYHSESQD